MRPRPVWIVGLLLACAVPSSAHIGTHEIQVRNSFFSPQELHIDVGETVTWNVIDGGHTITADDGRFDFFADRTVERGDRLSFGPFQTDETVFFHCKVHTAQMFGVIIVGSGTPPDPGGETPEVRAVPSVAFPSIGAAVRDAARGTIVDIAPGTYHEAVRVTAPGVVLRGAGTDPFSTRIEGASHRGIGISVHADDVSIENLAVRRHTFAGIYAQGVAGLRVVRVRVEDNDRFGVRADGVAGLVIEGSFARGSDTAGFSVEGCDPCDAIVSGSTAEANLTGIAVVNATGVVVRSSTLRANGTGIALKSLPWRSSTGQRGAHVYGNLVEANVAANLPRPPASEALDIPTGTGIWVSGGAHNLIESNVVSGHMYNVAITASTGPSTSTAVSGNALSAAAAADLAWDGIGVDVCFAGNGEASSEPPMIEVLYACARPTVGIPFPVVDARIAAFGL